ncbi:MAG: flagellar brake protein [bacterium]
MDDQIIEYSIQDLFRNIMGAFTTTPLEAVLIVAGVVALIAGSILFLVLNKRKRRKEGLRRAEHVFQDILHNFYFTPEEADALHLLGGYALGGPEYKYRILTSRRNFEEAVKKMRRENPLPAPVVEELERKLAFCCFENPEFVDDTRRLPEGTPLYIVTEGSEGFHGRVAANDPAGIVAEIGRIDAFESGAQEVKVQYQQGRQIFQYAARARKQESGTLLLDHSRELARLERRDFFRVKRKMHVTLRKPGSNEIHRVKLIDIGGGGAGVDNSESYLKEGDEVRMTLDLPKSGELPVNARVVRTSKEDAVAHLKFEDILEGTRDKIISFVLREEV